MSRKGRDPKEKRKALEVLVEEGVMFCQKHQQYLNVPMFYRKRCYHGRRQDHEQCPYLKLRAKADYKKKR